MLAAAQRHGDGRRLAGREVQRREAHRAVQREPAASPRLGGERYAGLPERTQIPFDRAETYLEVPGQLPRRSTAWPCRAQLLDQGVQAVNTVHDRSVGASVDIY